MLKLGILPPYLLEKGYLSTISPQVVLLQQLKNFTA